MAYNLKNTTGIINTRITDTGRLKLSQGNFGISYFQIGDSEVTYNVLPDSYTQSTTNILEPNYNSQNSVGVPQSNKQNIKYPFFVDGTNGSTYGIPFMDSQVYGVFNSAAMRGFFTGQTDLPPVDWSVLTNNEYVVSTNYVLQMSTLTRSNVITLIYSGCNTDIIRTPQVGDFITIFYDGNGGCGCSNLPTPTVTPTSTVTPTVSRSIDTSPTPTPTPSATYIGPCQSPTPTPTPSATYCSPTPTYVCPPIAGPTCLVSLSSCYQMLTYRIISICNDQYTLDRETPDYSYLNNTYYSRTIIYPASLTSLYDSITPRPHWNDNVIDFESVCGIDAFDVKIWNMNIPWSESPAGIDPLVYNGYSNFGSITYLGTKEYLGYGSNSGQTDTDSTYYYNSFDEKVILSPSEQKAIAIVHYTNNTIDSFYGEKFGMQPYSTQGVSTGFGRHFRFHIPWLMWHKSPTRSCYGQTFFVDPEDFEEKDLFQPHYIESSVNLDMNSPGIRYYHLWDTNANVDGIPNRIGKVFPDQKIIIIDDEEIVAAMSYKSNRNWTLPSPTGILITPNTTSGNIDSGNGVLSANTEFLYVTYRLSNSTNLTNSLHCNYYTKVQGPNLDSACVVSVPQNVGIRFGNEFPYLTQISSGSTSLIQGFQADTFELLFQKVTGDTRPDPSEWKLMDYTDHLTATTVNGYITQSGMTGVTFVITDSDYQDAATYDLGEYINLTPLNYTGTSLNFGDEYYFYGNLETDIQATIYEMRYKVNLGITEFLTTTNPTHTFGENLFVTEIGLYDSDKNLMVISKMQSPVQRQGIQQFLIKFDF